MSSAVSRRAALAAVLAICPCLASTGMAQDWPTRPLRLIVPFPSGGPSDLLARLLAQGVARDLAQPVVIENRPGASGAIGVGEASRVAPDGYTLVLGTSSTHAILPLLQPKLPYDAIADFTPIAHVGDSASVLLVSSTLPVHSVQELISYARAHPGALNYASSGNGTSVHLTTEAFLAQAGIRMTHIPYKGTSQATPDLMAGGVQVMFDALASGLPTASKGRVRALAVTGERRSALAPELPTLAEAGLPGFSANAWFGIYGPKGMAPALVQRIHDAFERAIRTPDVATGLIKLGVESAASSSMQFANRVAADSQRWKQLIQNRKIALEQ